MTEILPIQRKATFKGMDLSFKHTKTSINRRLQGSNTPCAICLIHIMAKIE